MLTPIDIESKKFDTAINGYKKSDVTLFMKEILKSYESVFLENVELKDKVKALQDYVSYYKSVEKNLQETLIMAQKAAEETKSNARYNAEIIEKEARAQAREILDTAREEIIEIKNSKDDILKSYEISKMQLKNFLEMQLQLLENNDFDLMKKVDKI